MIDVKAVAHLARLTVTAEEVKTYESQLNFVFQHFAQISAIDTKNVEPLVTPTEMALVFREDHKEIVQTVEEAMKNAPERSGNLFKVPPVV